MTIWKLSLSKIFIPGNLSTCPRVNSQQYYSRGRHNLLYFLDIKSLLWNVCISGEPLDFFQVVLVNLQKVGLSRVLWIFHLDKTLTDSFSILFFLEVMISRVPHEFFQVVLVNLQKVGSSRVLWIFHLDKTQISFPTITYVF